MKRRDFITLLGGAAAAWPLAVDAALASEASGQRGDSKAQQPDRMRRVGVLLYLASDDSEGQARLAAFAQGLKQLGWSEGRNLRIDIRWATADDVRRHAAELVELAPDVLVAGTGTPTVVPLLQATRTVPIVFVTVVDPVGSGFIASLAQPGGNATGFTIHEYSMSGKWLELLKELAPRVTRAAVLRDPAVASGTGQFGAVQIVAPSLGMEVTPVDVRDAGEIERAVSAFASGPNGGLIVTGSALAIVHRKVITGLAARYKLPAVYPARPYVTADGLISYGPDLVDQFRRAAGYVDRILKGEKPADLPVQAPTKYELVINLRTAKALGLTVPETLLARADEVIE
jgi:putative tryptophan/tyrosine transport system substrate-binding protein